MFKMIISLIIIYLVFNLPVTSILIYINIKSGPELKNHMRFTVGAKTSICASDLDGGECLVYVRSGVFTTMIAFP